MNETEGLHLFHGRQGKQLLLSRTYLSKHKRRSITSSVKTVSVIWIKLVIYSGRPKLSAKSFHIHLQHEWTTSKPFLFQSRTKIKQLVQLMFQFRELYNVHTTTESIHSLTSPVCSFLPSSWNITPFPIASFGFSVWILHEQIKFVYMYNVMFVWGASSFCVCVSLMQKFKCFGHVAFCRPFQTLDLWQRADCFIFLLGWGSTFQCPAAGVLHAAGWNLNLSKHHLSYPRAWFLQEGKLAPWK